MFLKQNIYRIYIEYLQKKIFYFEILDSCFKVKINKIKIKIIKIKKD